MHYSLLDLANIPEGGDAAGALRNSIDLARNAEQWGYHRFWLAEHHNMTGIASAATAVLVGQIAAATRTIRVGAGGVMLPNHAPLTVAEAFGTLASLYPDRIDLGLGRAPGGDGAVIRALRRTGAEGENFPHDVLELLSYLGEADPRAPVRAIPGQGTHVPVWILGSSLYGAGLAAHFGLPYAFASHFAPDALGQALALYRSEFRPSKYLDAPRAMVAVNVFAADTRAEALRLRSSMEQAFANLRIGKRGPLPRPVADITDHVDANALRAVGQMLSVSATGTREEVADQLAAIVEATRADELILCAGIHDPVSRLRSFEIAAEAMSEAVAA